MSEFVYHTRFQYNTLKFVALAIQIVKKIKENEYFRTAVYGIHTNYMRCLKLMYCSNFNCRVEEFRDMHAC